LRKAWHRTSILLLVCGGLWSMAGCTPAAPPPPPPSQTRVEQNRFSITLPGEWSLRPDSNADTAPAASESWVYGSDDTSEQVTVSLLKPMDPIPLWEQDRLLEHVVDDWTSRIHGASLNKMSGVRYFVRGGVHAATFDGFATDVPNRRFSCLALSCSTLVALFHYESRGLSQSNAKARARQILGSASIHD
jgi:hypothetical protein